MKKRYVCEEHNKVFKTAQGLAGHNQQVHGFLGLKPGAQRAEPALKPVTEARLSELEAWLSKELNEHTELVNHQVNELAELVARDEGVSDRLQAELARVAAQVTELEGVLTRIADRVFPLLDARDRRAEFERKVNNLEDGQEVVLGGVEVKREGASIFYLAKSEEALTNCPGEALGYSKKLGRFVKVADKG